MRIGIIAPSIFYKSGGLEYQVLNLTKNINFDFYFFKDITTKNIISSEIPNEKIINFDKNKIDKIKFDILYLYKTKQIDLFILFFSWHEVEFWYDIFKNINVPFIYSERTEPELIKIRWDSKKREDLITRANGVHFLFKEYSEEFINFNQKILINQSESLKTLNKNNFLYVGSINYFPKQTNIILNIFKNNSNLILNVCGTGDINIINYYKQFKNIIFHGYLFGESLINQYKQSDCLVVPSRYEGCPNCILDGINLNKPIIAYKSCGGSRNLLKNYHSGILAKDDKMEETIFNFINNKTLYFQKWENFIIQIGKTNVRLSGKTI